MKITTRIAIGYEVFIAVLAALALYQAITIHRMQSVNRALSGAGFQNAEACLEALRDRDRVEASAANFFRMPADPDSLKELQESQSAFEARLKEIKTHAGSDEERSDVQRLSQLWNAYLAEQAPLLQNPPKSGSALPESLQNVLDQLQAQTLSVYRTALRSASSSAEKSRKAGETAASVFYCVVAMALAIGILMSILICRSISKPLANLTKGTRAMAEGKLLFRLDASGNDELSQLAKDFNTLTHRLTEK
jgi:two-component system, NtrC family, sensor histidine kinase KinB